MASYFVGSYPQFIHCVPCIMVGCTAAPIAGNLLDSAKETTMKNEKSSS